MEKTRTRSLSDFWREDRSDDRVMELASILQGGDSMIGVMGSDVHATWSTDGMSSTWWTRLLNGNLADRRIFLDYAPIAKLVAPFSGAAVDEIIGEAAHEAGHILWTPIDTSDELMKAMRFSTDRKVIKVVGRPFDEKSLGVVMAVKSALRVHNIVEDAFIDYHVGEVWPVLGEYIQTARRGIARRRPIDLTAVAQMPNPPWNHIVNLWIGVSLYSDQLPAKMSPKVQKAMSFLVNHSLSAIRESDGRVRISLAFECWLYLLNEFVEDEKAELPRQMTPPKPEEKAEPTKEPEKPTSQAKESEAGEPGEKPEPDEDEDEDEDETPESDEGEGGEDEKPESGEPDEGGAEGGGEGDEKGEDAPTGIFDGMGGEPKSDGNADDGKGKGSQADDAPISDGQELGHMQGDEKKPTEDGEEQKPEEEKSSDKGGDQKGHIGNLDDFDVRENKPVPKGLAEEVASAVSHDLEDLSKSVAEVMMDSSIKNVQTRKADYDAPMADKVLASVQVEVSKMKRVFDRQSRIESRTLKGMVSGRLDGRSLAKVGTGDMRVFKRRNVVDKPDMAIDLLLDASGSMNRRMDTVYKTGAIFAEALVRKPGINFQCLVYTGGFYAVETTRICDRSMPRLCLKNVTVGGGTPSGPAIASVKVLMDRMPEKDKVLIHFTDGEPDDENAVITAVAACRKAGYTVWAIAPRECEGMLAEQYGEGNYETIESVSDLPEKVEELVMRLTTRR